MSKRWIVKAYSAYLIFHFERFLIHFAFIILPKIDYYSKLIYCWCIQMQSNTFKLLAASLLIASGAYDTIGNDIEVTQLSKLRTARFLYRGMKQGPFSTRICK